MNILANESKAANTIAGALAGTTAMTAFSYALSKAMKEQFREPELLSFLVHEQPLVKLTRSYKWADKTSGYILHYLAGVGYAAGYEYLWKPAIKLPTVIKGAAYGVLAGLSGVAVWEATISLREKPPRLDKGKYYAHLVLAHVVFGATTALVSRAMSNKQD
ncbi:hypothetical protein [Cesiribacter sp. SM1]|uniref:hypothetical protein n=1 Tax=Cesiribacter sp. SM1 TaxID=2861196 RepID=UPI001CD51AC8|nr:hypothetical protein [Cesiribacter sp. SM1]